MDTARCLRIAGAAIFLSLLAPQVAKSAASDSLDKIIDSVRAEVNPLESMEFMRSIYSTDRWFTFPKFAETAADEAGVMRRLGLKNVEILSAPADGVTQVGYWTMPMAWDIRRGTLEITSPTLPLESRLLSDYASLPTSVGMWSGPTPAGGITAEVVELKKPTLDEIRRLDLRGKFVLTAADLRDFKWMLVNTGAVGTISGFTENPDFKDARNWINSWGDFGWSFTKKSTPLVSFSISPRQFAMLQSLLAKGRVEVKATVDSRYYAGQYPMVTGVIPGSGSDEEVLTLGHSSEQGAGDNATGVAAMLEAMSTIERLIESGRLPRPRRTIRILTMGEIYGSMSYLLAHPDRARRTVAAMCLDTPATSYSLAGSEYTFYVNPQVASSYVDALILKIAAIYFPKIHRPWHSHIAASGGDTYMSDPMIGIPTTWAYTDTFKITHHNSADTPDRVDARSLRDLSVVDAAFLYSIASAGDTEAQWMAELALTRGYEQILEAADPFFDRISAAADARTLGTILAAGIEKIEYQAGREKQAVTSAARLSAAGKARFEELAARLDPFGKDQSSRLRSAVDRRAAELGLPVPVQAVPEPVDAAAARVIVHRKRIGTLPLDDLSPADREGYPSGAWDMVPITALYWCDGHRSLAEVIRLTHLERGPFKLDLDGYFHFLARHGYVDLSATPEAAAH